MGKAIPSTRKPTAVFLEAEVEGEKDKIKMFFCFNCRIPLIEYTGRVILIVPGRVPFEPSTVLKCKGNVKRRDGTFEECGYFYSFIGTVYTKIPETT